MEAWRTLNRWGREGGDFVPGADLEKPGADLTLTLGEQTPSAPPGYTADPGARLAGRSPTSHSPGKRASRAPPRRRGGERAARGGGGVGGGEGRTSQRAAEPPARPPLPPLPFLPGTRLPAASSLGTLPPPPPPPHRAHHGTSPTRLLLAASRRFGMRLLGPPTQGKAPVGGSRKTPRGRVTGNPDDTRVHPPGPAWAWPRGASLPPALSGPGRLGPARAPRGARRGREARGLGRGERARISAPGQRPGVPASSAGFRGGGRRRRRRAGARPAPGISGPGTQGRLGPSSGDFPPRGRVLGAAGTQCRAHARLPCMAGLCRLRRGSGTGRRSVFPAERRSRPRALGGSLALPGRRRPPAPPRPKDPGWQLCVLKALWHPCSAAATNSPPSGDPLLLLVCVGPELCPSCEAPARGTPLRSPRRRQLGRSAGSPGRLPSAIL